MTKRHARYARRWVLLASCLLPQVGVSGSAKILLYHHVSTETPAATSVAPAAFDTHLNLIGESGYRVVPLQQIVDALVSGGSLDSKWVAITFDDAYESLLDTAAPRLHKLGWPFTVFVGVGDVEAGHKPYLDWDGLRRLEAMGASVGNHGLTHEHMVRRHPGESQTDWSERQVREIMQAQTRLEEELAAPQRLFAYPYGEFDADVAHLMQSLGFISFGQQSGPVGNGTNLYAIPRFPLATGFDTASALAEKLRTESLPVDSPGLPVTVLPADAKWPVLDLELDPDADLRKDSMSCFLAGRPDTNVDWISDRHVRISPRRPLTPGRSRYTCTAPVPGRTGAYYWHSHLFIRPNADGSWPEE